LAYSVSGFAAPVVRFSSEAGVVASVSLVAAHAGGDGCLALASCPRCLRIVILLKLPFQLIRLLLLGLSLLPCALVGRVLCRPLL